MHDGNTVEMLPYVSLDCGSSLAESARPVLLFYSHASYYAIPRLQAGHLVR